ncbi:M4 family metallopeptidase [Streptomyces chilikensis]|uniref:M4 family metallopeptidase n=1 Tax=Streptomyces chilikensis TaxID=1194079 RepID=A0ABV3ESR4_9ACTN
MIRRTHRRAVSAAVAVVALAGLATAAPAAAEDVPAGRVFMVNPVQSSGDQTLVDAKDSASAVPDSAYALATLRNLDGSGRLSGRWVTVRSETGAPATVADADSYDRQDDGFEQVMAYFWINETQEYLQSLGFGSELPGVNDRVQPVRLNQWGADNSYFTDRKAEIRLGKGGVDDAEDAEVIIHEYGHAVHHAQVPGYGTSVEAGAIGEAFGDYLAVTVGDHATQRYGWTRAADLACVADWDSAPYSAAPHCLRRVDGTRTYADRVGQVHADGQIWSRALFDIRGALGARTADRVIVNAQFDFAPDTSFADAASATVATAQEMYGPEAAATVRAAFRARGIPGV